MSEALKAYRVWDIPYEFTTCYVLAENASKAKYAALFADDKGELVEYFPVEMRAIRIPELDDGISSEALHTHGLMWSECPGCGQRITHGVWSDEDDGEEYEAFFSPTGNVWCSESCYRAHPKQDGWWGASICLYHDY